MAINNEALVDAIQAIIEEEGREVLAVGWDSDAPGMSGAHWITRWKNLYFFHSSDLDDEGPFESLGDVLAMEEFSTATSGAELTSEVLSLKLLKEIALSLVGDGDTVFINGEGFVKRSGTLRRVE
jgi:hypothetical protein